MVNRYEDLKGGEWILIKVMKLEKSRYSNQDEAIFIGKYKKLGVDGMIGISGRFGLVQIIFSTYPDWKKLYAVNAPPLSMNAGRGGYITDNSILIKVWAKKPTKSEYSKYILLECI